MFISSYSSKHEWSFRGMRNFVGTRFKMLMIDECFLSFFKFHNKYCFFNSLGTLRKWVFFISWRRKFSLSLFFYFVIFLMVRGKEIKKTYLSVIIIKMKKISFSCDYWVNSLSSFWIIERQLSVPTVLKLYNILEIIKNRNISWNPTVLDDIIVFKKLLYLCTSWKYCAFT